MGFSQSYCHDYDVCGHCKYHRHDPWADTGEWVCMNQDSDCYGAITEYNDTCEDFEARG